MSRAKPDLYLAGPLFSDAEREFNKRLKENLERYFQVYLPQEDGDLLVDLLEAGFDKEVAINHIFSQDIDAILNADVLLIILDGRSVDEGAAFELGFAYAREKTCIGLQTDPRRLLTTGNNPMIEVPCDRIFSSKEELFGWAEELTHEKELV